MEKIDLIKYEGDNSTFVWKHPVEDFYTGVHGVTIECTGNREKRMMSVI